MSDQIIIAFSETERTAQAIKQAGEHLTATRERLSSSITALYQSGLQGAFLDGFVSKNRSLLNTLNYLAQETLEAGTDLQTTVTEFRSLDAQCAALFASRERLVFATTGGGGSWGNTPLPGEWLDSEYGAKNYLWDAFSLASKLGYGKGITELILEAPETRHLLSMITQNPKILDFLTINPVAAGIADGAIDVVIDGDYSLHNMATQVVSGGIQAVLTKAHPLAMLAMAGNTAAQLGGHALSQVVLHNAEYLAGGDPEFAAMYRQQADDLDHALEHGNLDRGMDAVVSNMLDGNQLGAAVSVVDAVFGVAEISYEFQTTTTLIVDSTALRAGNAIMDAVGVDDGLQAQINQMERMNLHDLQDLKINRKEILGSVQEVAERDYNYFRDMLNL